MSASVATARTVGPGCRVWHLSLPETHVQVGTGLNTQRRDVQVSVSRPQGLGRADAEGQRGVDFPAPCSRAPLAVTVIVVRGDLPRAGGCGAPRAACRVCVTGSAGCQRPSEGVWELQSEHILCTLEIARLYLAERDALRSDGQDSVREVTELSVWMSHARRWPTARRPNAPCLGFPTDTWLCHQGP